MKDSKKLKFVALATLLVALGLFISGHSIRLKAILAQHLLRSAWAETITEGGDVKPWPWADTFPVARLFHDSLGVDLIVLAGNQGAVLAFGPGHMSESSLPPQLGNCVIAGHKDTSFAFLRQVKRGDVIRIQNRLGDIHSYQVTGKEVVHRQNLYFMRGESSWLTLTTCYPFVGLETNGDLRMVVSARLLEEEVRDVGLYEVDARS